MAIDNAKYKIREPGWYWVKWNGTEDRLPLKYVEDDSGCYWTTGITFVLFCHDEKKRIEILGWMEEQP
jgi:hypothetical protein